MTYSELLIEMSKSDRDELRSRLTAIMEHMLKLSHLQHLVSRNVRLWTSTILRERREIIALIKKHPGLKSLLTQDLLATEAYKNALAAITPEFPEVRSFPGSCPYSLAEVAGDKVMDALKKKYSRPF